MILINCVSEDEPSLAVMQKMLDQFKGFISIQGCGTGNRILADGGQKKFRKIYWRKL